MKKRNLLISTAILGTAAYFANRYRKQQNQIRQTTIQNEIDARYYANQQAYLIGGGLAMLAAATYLIQDARFPADQIHILEATAKFGGSNDGAGTNEAGFIVRGGRMLNEETYENFWDLFSRIPSLEWPDHSVTDEILNFDHLHPTHAQARVVDRYHNILNVHEMGFNQTDRNQLTQLLLTPEKDLDEMTIQNWFSDHFFQTNFWYMWQTTFAFQTWSSLFEFRRYMKRMILEFSRIDTLAGVTRTPYNQYDSVILPIKTYLQDQGVKFELDQQVTDIDFAEGEELTATKLTLRDRDPIYLNEEDIVILTNGAMTDSATTGDLHEAAPVPSAPAASAVVWGKIAKKRPDLGDPEPFFGHESETAWESFTVTCKGTALLDRIQEFSGNIPGSGALMTLKDSSWLMSTVVAAQPHFPNQDPNVSVFWGYGLHPEIKGDFIDKSMKDATGEEILYEWVCQMGWQDDWEDIKKDVINVIPAYMPYIDAQFQSHKFGDRPLVYPKHSTNFAMASQFVEQPHDMVFTEEYSVRAARSAVYQLMKIDKPIAPVTRYDQDLGVLTKALHTMYR